MSAFAMPIGPLRPLAELLGGPVGSGAASRIRHGRGNAPAGEAASLRTRTQAPGRPSAGPVREQGSDIGLGTAVGDGARTLTRGALLAERSDEQLLAASLDGDTAAFAALVDRYRNDLLHFLIRFLGSRAAAEDVFQDTFLQVHLSARTFDPERRFKPWLFTIAANRARDHHRRHMRRTPLSLSAPANSEEGSDAFVDLMASDEPLPEMPMLESEQSHLVRQVVDELPPHHREILLLSYFQRMSYNQIAECLEIPLGTVKSRLHAAVARFAEGWRTARLNQDSTT